MQLLDVNEIKFFYFHFFVQLQNEVKWNMNWIGSSFFLNHVSFNHQYVLCEWWIVRTDKQSMFKGDLRAGAETAIKI